MNIPVSSVRKNFINIGPCFAIIPRDAKMQLKMQTVWMVASYSFDNSCLLKIIGFDRQCKH